MIWMRCKRLPHLIISSNGDVLSTIKKRLLKLQHTGIIGSRYPSIGYKINGKARHIQVHRLVAETFIPNPLKKPCVNHKDGNKYNNSIKNLEWATHQENAYHAVDTGLNPKRGQSNPNSKLKNTDIPLIISRCKGGELQMKIAKEYGMHQSAISRIVNRVTYNKI